MRDTVSRIPNLEITISDQPIAIFISNQGGGSGGYLDFIFRSAARTLFGVEVEGELEYKEVRRNKDFQQG